MAKVFISHRGADLASAERLAQSLVAAGHQAWLDEWEIGVGDSIVAKVAEGLNDATALLLCLSASGMSEWMNREWMSTLSEKLRGRQIRLVPVLLEGGARPGILADIKAARMHPDWDEGLRQILRALERA
jgi:hypothetical protein